MTLLKNKHPNRIRMTREEMIYQIIINIIMILVVLCCVVPLLYVIGMSLSSEGEMLEKNYFVIFPEKPILSAYEYVINSTGFFRGMFITISRTVLGTIGAMFLPITMGYTLAKPDFPFRKGILIYVIATMILGGGLIPSYLLMNKLHLLNSFWVYVIPSLGYANGVLVVKLFVEGLPKDILDSAELDGASELQKLVHIALPLLKPTLLALGLFAAVAHWNDWFNALVFVRDADLFPVQLIVRNLFNQPNQVDMFNNVSAFAKTTPTSIKMASVVIAVLPILCVYPFLQKYFIYGMYTGSVKE